MKCWEIWSKDIIKILYREYCWKEFKESYLGYKCEKNYGYCCAKSGLFGCDIKDRRCCSVRLFIKIEVL